MPTSQATLAGGIKEMAPRNERLLTNDAGIGTARHADASHEQARELPRRKKADIPML